jgi:hypothetical protein
MTDIWSWHVSSFSDRIDKVLKIREANNAIMPAPTGELFWKAEIVIKPIKISARLQSLAEPWERIDHNYKLHGVG